MFKSNRFIVLLAGFVFFMAFFGCAKKVRIPQVSQETQSAKEEEPSVHDKEYLSISELKNVNFVYDSVVILPKARNILQSNAKYLKSHSELEILVEGHCCECGTAEYNLALGQKRASVVRSYYINLGIPAGKIGTISYGEEKPININAGPPDSSLCSENRRVETKTRVK